jgi:hypothetical protein
MLPTEMVDSFKDHLHAGNNFWSGSQIWRRLFDSQQAIIRYIAKEDPSFWVKTADITFVADQATYDLPLNARLGTKIIFAENRDNPIGAEVPWSELGEYPNFNASGVINLVSGMHFTLRGGQVQVFPTPTTAKTDAVRMWYTPSFGNMIQGTASAGGGSTLTLFTTEANYSLNHGWKDVRDDYYNAMEIVITGGTGSGQTRTISDYVGSTSVLTVDTAWTTTPDSTSTFAILCPVPEDFHHVVVTHAAMTASTKGQKRRAALQDQFFGSIGRPGDLFEMLGWVQNRQSAKFQTVKPLDIGY